MKDESIRISVLEERVCNMNKQNNLDHAEILKQIEGVNHKLDKSFVMKNELDPVKERVSRVENLFKTLGGIAAASLVGYAIKVIFSHQIP